MDLSNLGDLMRKTQASILERGMIFKDNDPVKDVSMIGLLEFGWRCLEVCRDVVVVFRSLANGRKHRNERYCGGW